MPRTVLVPAVVFPLVLAVCAARAGEGEAFFVALSGDDANPGTIERPWRTIQRAVERAQPGVTISVRAGVYDEEVRIEKSGTADKPIVLQNFPGERPVIDPNFKRQYGIWSNGSHVNIKGFEIRNVKADPKHPYNMGGLAVVKPAVHCLIEGNLIHRIIGGEKKPRLGIYISGGGHVTVQHNTVYEVVGHTESMGILLNEATDAAVRRNLVYFCDKEGLRLITQDSNTENIVEGNIAVHNHMGIAINNCRTDKQTIVRNNFCGWNWGRGINPKHTKNVVLTHNTVVGNEEWGIDIHGSGTVRADNYGPVVENNLLSQNLWSWWLYDPEVFDERVDFNFYHSREGSDLALFGFGQAQRCRSLSDIREKTTGVKTMNGPYDLHGKEGDPLFAAPAIGDFRLRPGSPAQGAASDGQDMGALESELIEVGADRKFSLANIPDLGRLKLTVESFSSQTPDGPATNVVDSSRPTYWELDTTADDKREIVLALPGNRLHELAYITLVKYGSLKTGGDDTFFYRQFELLGEDESGAWLPLAEPPEHPFAGYGGLYNGETWPLPAGTKARKVKVRFVSGYGKVIRIPEIRIYGKAPAARAQGE